MQMARGALSTVVLVFGSLLAGCGGGGGGGGGGETPDFRLSLDQTDVVVVVGESVTVSIEATPVAGFRQDIQLAVSGLAVGVTATLSPALIPGGAGTSSLRLDVGASVPVGNYPIALDAVSTTVSKSIPVTLRVVLLPPIRFDLAVSPASVSTTPGQSTETMVTVTPVGGFNETVQLSVEDAPAALTATFAPPSLSSGAARLTLAAGAALPVGLHVFSVRGTSGTLSFASPLTLAVAPASTSNGVTLRVPSTVSTRPGGSTALHVRVQRALGVTGTVTLAATGLPAGITGGFLQNPCTTAGTALSLTVGSNVAPGVYAIGVQATAGSSTGRTGLLIEVVQGGLPVDAWVSRIELAQSFVGEDFRLVPRKPTLVRAHILADTSGVTSPVIRLSASDGTRSLGTLQLTGPTTLPAGEDMATLNASFTATLPTSWIVSGLELTVEVDADDVIAERDESNNTKISRPEVALDTTLNMVIVPLVLAGRTGVAPNVRTTLIDRWPVRDIAITVHAPYTVTSVSQVESNGNGWGAILSELAQLRTTENSSAYYYGVLKPGYGSGVAGIGYIGAPIAVGRDDSLSTAAHELGHNFGLRHAPCGGASGTDPNYPYPGAIIGSQGYRLSNGQLISPLSYKDLMSYCGPSWISDYNYDKVHTRLAPAPMRARQSAPAQPALIVTGAIGPAGVTVDTVHRAVVPVPSPGSGSHTLALRAAGRWLTHPFTPVEIGCGPEAGVKTHFSVAVPDLGPLEALSISRGRTVLFQVAASQVSALARGHHRLAVQESAGSLTVTWDARVYRNMAVTHVVGAKRTALALRLSGGRADLTTAHLPPGGHFEISLASGLRGERVTVPRG